jgi:hypothetical protein
MMGERWEKEQEGWRRRRGTGIEPEADLDGDDSCSNAPSEIFIVRIDA